MEKVRPGVRHLSCALALLLSLGLCACTHMTPPPAKAACAPQPQTGRSARDSAPAAGTLQPSDPAVNDYLIGPNDVITIRVFEQTTMDTQARVAGDGTIRFPMLGVIQVAGLNERKLEETIQNRLRGKFLQDPHVTVFVTEPHAREVAIVGQVKTPGLYPVYGRMTVIDLISKAGGLTEKAGGMAYVIRKNGATHSESPDSTALRQALAEASGPDPRSIKIDLKGLLLRGEEKWNIALNVGDCVSIPDAGFIHVTGLGVEKPGTFELKNAPNTFSEFIDEAGGLKFSASDKMLLIRRTPDGQDLIIPVNYAKITADPRNDIPVQSGDTLLVNRAPIKTVLAAIGTGISTVFRATIYYSLNTSGSNGTGL